MANLLSSTIGSHFYGSYNQSNILLKTAGNTGDGGILLQNSAGAFKFQIYGNGTDYGFLDGVWADWDIRKTINGKLYLNGTSSYYLQTDGHSYLSTLHVADASSGVSLHVGSGSTHGVYTLDNARKYLVVSAPYYPHMALVASGSNNTNHGAVFSFVGTEGDTARQWNLGISNQNPFLFSIGYNRTGDNNPHYGVGDNWSSDDSHHARLSIDTSGNTKIRGMLYVNGTSGGISTGNAVIHAGNIGSQSVSYASSAGNSSQLEGFSAYALVAESRGTHSGSDFPNGTLVTTDIDANGWAGDSFIMEVSGKSYGSGTPFKLIMEGYLYADTIINVSAMSYGSYFPAPVKVMRYNGNIAFWWPRGSYWNSFEVHVRSANGDSWNRVTGITDSVDPASADKKISITPTQVIHTGNIASQSVSYADESGFASSAGSVEWTSIQNKPATFPPSSHTHDYLSNNSDSEQEVGLRYASWNAGAARMNTDPRWNESGYDADLGCLHIWAWTAGGSPYGRAGIALYNGSAYQYLTTRSGATGMFVNNQEIIHSGNIGSQSVSYASSSGNADTIDSLHASDFVRAYTTTNDNIDSDWGQSFKTFDPVPGGTPPIASPNLRTINVGNDFNRRTQLAFTYSEDRAWFRRRDSSGWKTWREFVHSGNIASQSVSYADESGFASSAGSVEWTNVQNKPSLMPISGIPSGSDQYVNLRVIGNFNAGSGSGMHIGYGNQNGGDTLLYGGGGYSPQLYVYGDHVYSPSSFRAPIFYDSNDTYYYVDPNSMSRISSARIVGGELRFHNGSYYSDLNYWGARFYSQDDGNGVPLYVQVQWVDGWRTSLKIASGIDDNNPSLRTYGRTQLATDGGFVGIATTSPFAELDVNGRLAVRGGNRLYWGATTTLGSWTTAQYASGSTHLFNAQRFDFTNEGYGSTTFAIINSEGVYTNNSILFPQTQFSPSAGSRTLTPPMSIRMFDNYFSGIGLGSDYGTVLEYYSRIGHVDTQVYFDAAGGSWYRTAQYAGGYSAWNQYITSGNIGSQNVNASNYQYATGSSSDAIASFRQTPAHATSFREISSSGPGGTWWMIQNFRHSNSSNYWGTQVAWGWEDNALRLMQRNVSADSWSGWVEYLNTNNAAYAWNMNQYVRTSDAVTFASTTTQTFLIASHSDNTKGYRIYNTSNSSVSAMFVNSSNQLVIAAGAVDQVNLNKKVLVNGVALGVNVAPSATAGRIDASNDIVAYSSSDERLKENITPIENALDKVKSLTGVEFDWKPEYKHAHGYEGHDTGIIAQQVEAVMPSAVRTNDTGFLAVRYEKLIGLLIEGMKEQQAQIDELKAKLDGLTK